MDSALVRADMESASPMRQSLRAAGKLPEELSGVNRCGVNPVSHDGRTISSAETTNVLFGGSIIYDSKMSSGSSIAITHDGAAMKKILIQITTLSLAGCVSSGVIPMGQDTFMITKQSSTGFHSASSVKAEVYQEGSAYCSAHGKEFQPVNERGVDGVPGRSFANAEVQFRCLTKGDPELRRPTMKPYANVRIENEIRGIPASKTPDSGDKYSELIKLKELLDAKILTQQEFDAQKAKLLSR